MTGALAGAASGQAPRRGQLVDLAAHPEVRREIKVTSDQEPRLNEVVSQLKTKKVRHLEARAEIAKVLKPDQVQRLDQVRLQVLDGLALDDPEVVKTLGLDAERMHRLDEARKVNAVEEDKMADVMKRARFRSAEDRNAFIAKYHKAAGERLAAVLSDEQKAKFREMKGRAIDKVEALP